MNRVFAAVAVVSVISCGSGTVRQGGVEKNRKYVVAESGLVLREGAGTSFKKTALMPLNSEVFITETSDIKVTVSGINGVWVKVRWTDKKENRELEGWCFSPYLRDKPLIRDCDVVFDGDPAVNIKPNKTYYNHEAKALVQSRLETSYIDGSDEYYNEEIEFLPDNKFSYSMNSRHSFDRGETFEDNLIFTGTYTIIERVVHLRYLQCQSMFRSSSEETKYKTVPLSLRGCPDSLRSAETDEKSYLKSSGGRIYIHNKNTRY